VNNNRKLLDHFIEELAGEIKQADPGVSVIRFGSSLTKAVENNLDVDILLLTQQNYFDGDFERTVDILRSTMLQGGNSSEMVMGSGNIRDRVIAYIEKIKSPIFNFIPVFVFGPYLQKPFHDHRINVFLHFKGPVTENQFFFFCTRFPFHGRSIIYNSKLLLGNFDCYGFDARIPDQKDMILFAGALQKRVEISTETAEICKCIKKLAQNYYIMQGIFQLNERELNRRINLDFAIILDAHYSLNELKLSFAHLHNQVMETVFTEWE